MSNPAGDIASAKAWYVACYQSGAGVREMSVLSWIVLLVPIGFYIFLPDNSMLNQDLQRIFERVRRSADFMPKWQMEVR